MTTSLPLGTTFRYNSITDYYKKRFGGRVQKLSIDAGFTCPNRDGTKGTGGCTYCSNDAFNPSYCIPAKPVSQQIKEGIEFHSIRYRRATKFLAYFQAYTNTFDALDRLKEIYEQALNYPGIIGLIIGTRPDCVSNEILNYLEELNQQYFISVEFGVESIYDETLIKINRGHTFSESKMAIHEMVDRGIHTGIHLIFGLPGESRDQMLASSGIISSLPVNSIKFHQLQILKNTAIEKEFLTNPSAFNLFSLEEYIDFIISYVERLNPDIFIDRFLAEVPPRFLAVHKWGLLRYDQVLQLIQKRFEERKTWQGKLF